MCRARSASSRFHLDNKSERNSIWDWLLKAKSRASLSEFLERFDKRLDLFVVAVLEGEIVGSVTIDGSGEPEGVARLRWFAVSPRAQGQGVGRALMTEAMTFCASSNVNKARRPKRIHDNPTLLVF